MISELNSWFLYEASSNPHLAHYSSLLLVSIDVESLWQGREKAEIRKVWKWRKHVGTKIRKLFSERKDIFQGKGRRLNAFSGDDFREKSNPNAETFVLIF